MEPRLEHLDEGLELREQALPDQAIWQATIQRVGAILGIATSPLLNATNVAKLVADAKDDRARDWVDRAEQWLANIKASEYSYLSSVLVAGFNQRLAQFAADLQGFLRGSTSLDQLEASVDYVSRHTQAATQPERMQRVVMALRLARFLATGPQEAPPSSLSRRSLVYAEQGGDVDWARRYLSGGDEIEELAKAFGALTTQVRQLREQQNRRFAGLLSDWQKTPVAAEGVLPGDGTN